MSPSSSRRRTPVRARPEGSVDSSGSEGGGVSVALVVSVTYGSLVRAAFAATCSTLAAGLALGLLTLSGASRGRFGCAVAGRRGRTGLRLHRAGAASVVGGAVLAQGRTATLALVLAQP